VFFRNSECGSGTTRCAARSATFPALPRNMSENVPKKKNRKFSSSVLTATFGNVTLRHLNGRFLRVILLNVLSSLFQDLSDIWYQQISGNLIVKINLLFRILLFNVLFMATSTLKPTPKSEFRIRRNDISLYINTLGLWQEFVLVSVELHPE
jgi:hypothetical protein